LVERGWNLANHRLPIDRLVDAQRSVRHTALSVNLTVHPPMAGVLVVTFCAGVSGDWRVESTATVVGEGLPAAQRLQMVEGTTAAPDGIWQLRGVISNSRYSTAAELEKLAAVSPALGRPEATAAALIAIRKTDAWWKMAQDDRRANSKSGPSTLLGRSSIFQPSPAVSTMLEISASLLTS
jgi:hypothetical protein